MCIRIYICIYMHMHIVHTYMPIRYASAYMYIFCMKIAMRFPSFAMSIVIYHICGTHCNTLQHTATHCNTLQYTVTHCIHYHV